MNNRNRALVVAVALGVGGFSLAATAASADGAGQNVSDDVEDANEGPDVAISGAALERASAVALEFTGEGRVTETEVEDEESYYEVEVTLDDGSEVDVQLDESFAVVGTD